ncbi:MAG: dockerin type I repeat-containing protein [Pyrinomonadaceae bacterium]
MKRFRLNFIFCILLFTATAVAAGVLFSTNLAVAYSFPSKQNNSSLALGPDLIVGNLSGLAQFGSSGTQVGLAMGTEACNIGTVDINWFTLPNNDHPVVPQNLYRMSGGAANDDRFEQIGQSNVLHAFFALSQNGCGIGCSGGGDGSHLNSGCSSVDSAGYSAGPTSLGSRAWINPFTGAFPGSSPNPKDHSGHTHNGVSHRILVEANDLNTTLNQGAAYYAEAQYVTPHESSWCQSNPDECNMYNNVSYRRFGVTGTSNFNFSPVESTVQTQPAIYAWPGAMHVEIEPEPGNDGIGVVGYKVTNPSPGVWHYEYAVYNQNLDRAIQSFSVPVDSSVTLSNIQFHAPPQHPGWAADGTVGNAGYSSVPWSFSQNDGKLTWNSETLAQNQNANAIRWGTMYNFRFDADKPPRNVNAAVGFFKTGLPITVSVQGPSVGPPWISGTITYGNAVGSPNPRFVSGAVVCSSTGSPPAVTFTDFPGGNYTLTGFGSGAYTIVAAKSDGQNGITSFDAAKIAQYAAGAATLTGNQLIVADVSNNGSVTSFDAAQVARYAAAMPPYGFTGTWKFLPASRTYASVVSNLTGEDYIGLLMGEVSGNWINTEARSTPAAATHKRRPHAP